MRKAYKDAMKAMPSEGIVTQSDVASQIFKPLMEHCILVKRKYAEKFRLVGLDSNDQRWRNIVYGLLVLDFPTRDV